MPDDEQQQRVTHQQLLTAVAARATDELLRFAQAVQPAVSFAEVGDILLGAACGIYGLDAGPAGTVAKLRATADSIERLAVNPDPDGRTN